MQAEGGGGVLGYESFCGKIISGAQFIHIHHNLRQERNNTTNNVKHFSQILFDQDDNSKDVEGGIKESHDDGTFVGTDTSPPPPSATIVGVSIYHALFLLFLLSV